jgi:hypothetical protein
MFYVITVDQDGHATGEACGPYDSATEAREMAVSGQVPVVPLRWLMALIERLAKHDECRAREHHGRDRHLCSYHSGREDGLRHLIEHMSAPSDSVLEQDHPL